MLSVGVIADYVIAGAGMKTAMAICLALATASFLMSAAALVRTLPKPETPHPPAVTSTSGVQTMGFCEQGYRRLPPSIQGAWSLGEFELKCQANAYVAICSNETVDFTDHLEQICPRAAVKYWWKFPDA
jgi:hypothetical protein